MGKLLIIKDADFSSIACSHIEPLGNKIEIEVSVSPDGGGVATGSGFYEIGEQVVISATANYTHEFIGWSDGVKEKTRTIVVGSLYKKYTAIFKDISDTIAFHREGVLNEPEETSLNLMTLDKATVFIEVENPVRPTDGALDFLFAQNQSSDSAAGTGIFVAMDAAQIFAYMQTTSIPSSGKSRFGTKKFVIIKDGNTLTYFGDDSVDNKCVVNLTGSNLTTELPVMIGNVNPNTQDYYPTYKAKAEKLEVTIYNNIIDYNNFLSD